MEIHKLPDLEFVFGHAGIEPLVFGYALAQTIRKGTVLSSVAGGKLETSRAGNG